MDEQAFALLIEPHRRALHLHCYRMLGSLHDADDALQETMLRAWKGADHYEPRAQLGTWLHTIATNFWPAPSWMTNLPPYQGLSRAS